LTTANRTAAELELADAAAVHASQHAPGGTDEVAHLRAAIRYQRLMAALGYTDETGPYVSANASSVTISQRLYAIATYQFAGEVITNLIVACNTAGTSVTLAKLGVLSSAGVLLASSADVSGSFASAGKKVVPMTSPYTILTDGFYWRVFLNVAATGAALMRLNGGSSASAAIPTFQPFQANQDAQADLPGTATRSACGSDAPDGHAAHGFG